MLLPRIRSPATILIHILSFTATFASAVDLAFTSPGFNKIAASGYPYFSVGQDVTISWTTPWQQTTVVVFQNVNGKVYYDILADANGSDNTTVTWTASGVKGRPLSGATFHFYLQNSNNFNCDTCYTNSRVFQITAATTTSTTRSAPRTTISSTAKGNTEMPTSASTSAGAAAAGSTGNAEESDNDGGGTNMAIPLGVGLGAGIPVFLALCGILFMFFHIRRKRREREQEEEATSEKGMIAGGAAGGAYYDSSPSGSDAPTIPQRSANRLSRGNDYEYGAPVVGALAAGGAGARPESGALGPWEAPSPSPTWEQQAQMQQMYRPPDYGQQDWQRERAQAYYEEDLDAAYLAAPGAAAAGAAGASRARHTSQKYDYVPFEPALPTQFETAEESRQSSRHGWIDDFPFERPGARDEDEMSDIRKSIHEVDGESRPRSKSQRSDARASIGDVSEIPQIPQPTWNSGLGLGDGNWPLR